MDVVKLMLTGEMDMPEFIALLRSEPSVQECVRRLVPENAKNNAKHELWKQTSFHALKAYQFDLYSYVMAKHRFDGSIEDNRNLSGTICTFYLYSYPDTICTHRYEEASDLYLTVIQDCFDGPEVESFVQEIIKDSLKIEGKGKRKTYAKNGVQTFFHIVDKKRPRWIQGPEWPMGAHSPMKFTGQKRGREKVYYYFTDTDTGEERIVEQFY